MLIAALRQVRCRHELSQPLGAIMLGADSAQRLFAAGSLEVDKLKEIVAEIREADAHAGDIVRHLRRDLRYVLYN
jgi:hypothetical protein